jgi:hypothetical protein
MDAVFGKTRLASPAGNEIPRRRVAVACALVAMLVPLLGATGCRFCRPAKPSPSVTAVGLSPANRCEPEGIPYYLPKPLLVIAKNVRHIDEAKVGLTNPAPIPNAFDSQGSYADVKANVAVPAANQGLDAVSAIPHRLPERFDDNENTLPEYGEQMTPAERLGDGLAPDCFYTYQIIFVPDLTQKYGLRVTGGAGEIRAAMNLVNGWMYTGMGPYYMKDSSTAQDMLAGGAAAMYTGRGVADVVNQIGELATLDGALGAERSGSSSNRGVPARSVIDRATALAKALQTESPVPQTMLNFAEITIYEPVLSPDGMSTEWKQIAQHSFDRQYIQGGMNEAGLKLFGQVLKQEDAESKARVKAEEEKPEQLPPMDGF